ncbi:MAG: MMPL family transporter, partial [Firmicutes bacterium]|nr:MMPL family transporter [Bacillota bacterium]
MVAHSKKILILFILLALGCAILIPMVNVNKDMTKYLPEDSSMRQGLDLMRTEFGEENASTLEVMFSDLKTQKEKDSVLAKLEDIKNVSSVDYSAEDKDKDHYYNKGKYTRFIINCDHSQYSDEAAELWQSVKTEFEETHEVTLGGTVNSANDTGLPLWIVVVAFLLVIAVLVIMAGSWIEPVAFLITIGLAILINMGTYVLFPSISNTTFGIVAILQLALSIDYSIMLLNRYRQQRQIIPDKKEAMEQALSLSFGAITGSSLTTFAGLLALVFMSFTIGADVGIALAKGVIISLICIFTVLPALLLGFDSLMLKTAKRSIPTDLPKLSGFMHRMRLPLTLLFAVMLIGSFIFRNGVDFSYSQSWLTDIDKVFGHTNNMVMLYDERDGKAAGRLAEKLDKNENVHSAVCYESSLGKQ